MSISEEDFFQDVAHELRFARGWYANRLHELRGAVVELGQAFADDGFIPEAGMMRTRGVVGDLENVAEISGELLVYTDLIVGLEDKLEWGIRDVDTESMYSVLLTKNNGVRRQMGKDSGDE